MNRMFVVTFEAPCRPRPVRTGDVIMQALP